MNLTTVKGSGMPPNGALGITVKECLCADKTKKFQTGLQLDYFSLERDSSSLFSTVQGG